MATNLVDLFQKLFYNPQETQTYLNNPAQYLQDNGVDTVSYGEITEAATLAAEAPVMQSANVTFGDTTVAESTSGPVNVGSGTAVQADASGGSSAAASVVGDATAGAPAPAPAPAAAVAPVAAPAPPPAPPADMPPMEAMEQVVTYYVQEVAETTQVTHVTEIDDRDTDVDGGVNSTIKADDGSYVDAVIDTETNTASGDGAVAAGHNAEGVATGDGAIAAGDSMHGNFNTGSNDGVMGDDAYISESVFGDGNTQLNDSDGAVVGNSNLVIDDNNGPVAVGSNNVQATNGGTAVGGDLNDADTTITISNSGLDNIAFGDGNQMVQDNDYSETVGSFNQDNSMNNSMNTDTSTNHSFNTDDSFDTEHSFNTDDAYNADQTLDVHVDQEAYEPAQYAQEPAYQADHQEVDYDDDMMLDH